MKLKSITILAASAAFLLGGCAAQPQGTTSGEGEGLTVLATTYPTYLMASAVAEGVDGVTVSRLNTGAVSCLHDYTLTVNDMKQIEQADVIVMNGAGLEDFMADALESAGGLVVDGSQGLELLENEDHDHVDGDEADHDHGHWDPHYWMDPDLALQMAENIQNALVEADGDNAGSYQANYTKTATLMAGWKDKLRNYCHYEEGPEIQGLITFHDGFRYFAQALDLPLLAAIEEEEGSEASAMEINRITQLVEEHSLPVIFTEVNGSDATAQAISRETGCAVAQLTMLMDGPEYTSLQDYYDGLYGNVQAIVNGFAGEEVMQRS